MATEYLAEPPPECGQRLLSILIDNVAKTHPERPFISVARGTSAAEGYMDVSFKAFSTAVNRCAWWIDEQLGRSEEGTPVFYIGPTDIRYLVILFAASKTGHVVS
jgi:acyl-CoA synthetase (AMP-forming)/AMP-acid ligase II